MTVTDTSYDRAGGPVFRTKTELPDETPGERMRLKRVVSRAKAGDGDAIRELYEAYADNVFSYVRTIIHDEHEAQDVTQHVFTKLIAKIGRYEERSVPFAAWLLRIARNCAIDHVRGGARTVCCEDVPRGDDQPHEEVAAEKRGAIREALEALPDGQRRVIVMRHVAGLSPREIAAEMGKSEGAVHTLHHRARRALCTELLRHGTSPVVMPPGRTATTGLSAIRG